MKIRGGGAIFSSVDFKCEPHILSELCIEYLCSVITEVLNPDDHYEIKGSAGESGVTKKDEEPPVHWAVAAKNTDHLKCLINIKDNCSEKVNGECSKY